MNWHLKYDKDYRYSIISIAVAIVTFSWIAIAIATLIASPSDSILGLSRTTATMTLFFMPTVTGSALLVGLNYWMIAKGKRIGLYVISESMEQIKPRFFKRRF